MIKKYYFGVASPDCPIPNRTAISKF